MYIKVVGYIASKSFQLTKFILVSLMKHHPELIDKYVVKGVMDIEWTRFLWILNQTLGGIRRKTTVAIFINRKYIGTSVDLEEYLAANYNFTISVWSINYKQRMLNDFENYFNNNKFSFVRMVFGFNNWEIGPVIFALFDDIAPKTCDYFKKLCMDKTRGYLNSSIHRIEVHNGFIQAGRVFNQMKFLKKENYTINHDRRGVLSLASRHTHFNGPELIISLNPNPWMNNKYVAFGYAVEGEKTLKQIEKLSSVYENINEQIRITSCDVLTNTKQSMNEINLETFFGSISEKSITKAKYILTYGKPGPLIHINSLTNLQYMESIVKIIICYAVCKIEKNIALSQETITLNNSKALRYSLIPILDQDNKEEKDNSRSLQPYVELNDGFNNILSPILKDDDEMLLEPKKTNINVIFTKKYSINLPTNHKNYWKYKKIFDSIAK